MRKAALHNLGCKVNSYETEAMQQLLEDAGYEIVPFKEGADVYIINTCSVTNIADRKSRQMLHRARKMNPQAVVVAAGCYVQVAGEELKKDEAIDLVIGNNKKADLVHILEEYFTERETQVTDSQPHREAKDYILDIGHTNEYEPLGISRIADHTRAFIKVQDGCNQFCSYCIIPYTRGRVRSRNGEEIIKEVEALVANGYKEIVLTGIHLSSYGVDFPEKDRLNLLGLIIKLHEIEGLERIRLGSLEPRIVTEEFAATLAGLSKICPHFHLSLQSGCEETLKRMNRHYTPAQYKECCSILRRAFSNPAITTDVIVGFPGETKEEFEKTKAFLQDIGFYEMHIFKYSKRAGTKAAVMKDQIPEPIKSERSDELLILDSQMSKAYRDQFLGSELEILIEDELTQEGSTYLIGHTKEYVKAAIPYEEGRKSTFATGVMKTYLSDDIGLLS